MKRPLPALTALIALGLAAARPAAADTTTFVSGPTWSVTDALGNPVGNAQYVAVNATYPTVQPPGVTNYDASNTNPSWQADLSSIPGAYWIWAPGVTGATPGASLAQYSFTHNFLLDGPVTTGTISLAADDYAAVSVNGASVGSIGSTTRLLVGLPGPVDIDDLQHRAVPGGRPEHDPDPRHRTARTPSAGPPRTPPTRSTQRGSCSAGTS